MTSDFPYQIQKKLTEGGMGEIFIASNADNQSVVIKRALGKSSSEIKRFHREYLFLKNIHHPTLPKVYDFFQRQHHYYLVMEYVSGTTLHETPPLDLINKLAIANQICLGFEALHKGGILHRDIKPDNILVTSDQVKIIDLGIGQSTFEEHSRLTRSGGIIGTPAYMSPEQANGLATFQSDIFSLGVTLSVFFHGGKKSPFDTGDTFSTLLMLSTQELPSLLGLLDSSQQISSQDKEIYLLIDKILEKATAKESEQRFSSMLEMGKAFADIYWEYVDENKSVFPIADVFSEDFAGELRTFHEQCQKLDKHVLSDTQPEKVGHYRILEEIGRGGMGVVYKAEDQKFSRVVALKLLFSNSSRSLQRFLREARANANLRHPNIIELYECKKEKDFAYIAMQYIEGENFEQLLSQNSLSLEQKLEIWKKMCQAVQYAHKKKIVHRDLKPSNILVRKDGHPFLTDFGLVQMADTSDRLTRTSDILGTPFYMSPEQMNGQKVDHRSDIYSLGVILYQILTRRYPFVAKTIYQLRKKINEEEALSPVVYNKDTPRALENICLRGIAKKTAYRYPRVERLLNDFQRYEEGKKVASYQAIRRYLILGSVILILSVMTGVSGFYFWSDYQAPASMEAAERFYQNGNWQAAHDEVERFLGSNPNHLDALMFLVQITEKVKNQSVREAWLRVSKATSDPKYLVPIIRKALKAGDFLVSEEMFSHLSIEGQKKYQGLLGEIYLLNRRLYSAQNVYEAVDFLPSQPAAMLNYVYVLYESNRVSLAQEYVSKMKLDALKREEDKVRFAALKLFLDWHEGESFLFHIQSSVELINHQKKKRILEALKGQQVRIKENIAQIKDSLYYSYLKQKLIIFEHFITAEVDPSNIILSWEECFASKILTQKERLSLQKSYLRYLIWQKNWLEVIEKSKEYIFRTPWDSDLRHFQGLAYLQLRNHSEQSLAAMEHAVNLNRQNYSMVDNILQIAYEDLSQQEATYVNQVIYFYQNYAVDTRKTHPVIKRRIYHLFFAQEVQRLRENFQVEEQKKFVTPKQLKFLQNLFFQSSKSRLQSIKLLEDIAGSMDLQPWLNDVRYRAKGINDPALHSSIESLKKMFKDKREQRFQKQILTAALFYDTRKEMVYLKQLDAIPNLEDKLFVQLRNTHLLPMSRLLIARLILARTSSRSLEKLLQIARSSDYPNNVIASVALQEKSLIFLEMENIEPFYSKLMQPEDRFWQCLVALNLDHLKNPDYHTELLNRDNVLVRLAACYSYIGRYYHARFLQGKETFLRIKFDEVKKVLREVIFGSYSPATQVFAVDLYWEILFASDYGLENNRTDSSYPFDVVYHEEFLPVFNHLMNHHNTNIKMSALRGVRNYWLAMSCFRNLEKRTPGILNPLRDKTRPIVDSDDYNLRFWSIAALGFIEDYDQVWGLLLRSDLPLSFKISAFIGSIAIPTGNVGYKEMNKILSLLPGFFRQKCKNAEDEKLRIFCLLVLVFYQDQRINQVYKVLIRNAVNDFYKANSKSKRARILYYSSLLWLGKETDIPALKKVLLKTKSTQLRKAAATSLAGLLHQYGTKEANESFQKSLKKRFSTTICKAAAWGYYDHHRRLFYNTRWHRFLTIHLHNFEMYENIVNKKNDPKNKKRYACNFAAVKLYPAPIYLYHCALLARAESKYQEAFMHINQALDTLKNNPEIRASYYSRDYLVAACLNLRGEMECTQKNERWEKTIEEAQNIFPNLTYLNRRVAWLYYSKMDFSVARNFFYRTLLSGDMSIDTVKRVAYTYIQQDKKAEAVNVIKNYIPYSGNIPTYDLHQHKVYRDSRNFLHKLIGDPWIENLPNHPYGRR